MTPGQDAFSPQRVARIAGAAYVITMATSVYPFLLSPLVVRGDAARTASNIVEHALRFRVQILVSDLVTIAGVVILNLALYELLEPVHRRLARLAALWRMVEVSVYAATTVNGLVVLSVLSGADTLQAFDPRQVQALVRVFLAAKSSGFVIAMLFLSLGSTIYMYLLLRSRYVPKALALLGLGLYPLGVIYFGAHIVFPAWVAATTASVRTLPAAAVVILAIVFAPLLAFEFILGFWLLVKGVRIPEGA